MSAFTDPRKIHFDARIGALLKQRRLDCKKTISQVANEAGIAKGTLAALEDGRGGSFYVFALLAEVYDCTLDDLAPIDALKVAS